MAVSMKLQKTFYEDLKKLSLFDEAVKLVEETYRLGVEVNKAKTEFEIKGNGLELLEFVETLLQSWLERKKNKHSATFEDRMKAAKENPLSDVFEGHVIWVFWGDLASKLSSKKYKKEVEKLKFVQEASVAVNYKKEGRLPIMCNFETFKDVKLKVEKLKLLVAPKSNDTSQADGPKCNSNQDHGDSEIKGKDKIRTTVFDLTAGSDNQNKSVKSETSTDNGESFEHSVLRSSEGASGGQNLPPDLGRTDHTSDPSSHSSGFKEKSADDKLLFCAPSGRIKVFVYAASIINLSGVDAIVNAANEDLKHIGGVAYHISEAAGGDKSALEIECRNYIKQKKKVDVTKNFTSSAGNMQYKGVIHAVGPMWSHYQVKDECKNDLYMTIINVLLEANKRKFSKIALPAISSGIYGVPRRLCAEMYIKGVIDYDHSNPQTQVKEIHFVDIKTDILQEIREAYGRWKQNDKSLDFKNADSYSSASEKNVSRQSPSASQYQKGSEQIHTFRLTKKTCVKVYKCSIVEVKDVHAIACAVNSDFSVEHRQVAKLIRKIAGHDYELEFTKKESELRLKPREDVLICGAGKLAKTQNIKYVIHVKLGKIESLDDIEKLRHLFIQIFGNACQKKMLKIALPLIGAATLKRASDDVIQHCSRLYVKILQEVVEGKGNDMSVEEVHLVDLDENIISFVVKAFEEQTTSNHEMPDQKERSFKKSISSKTPGKDEMVSHSPRPGNGEAWLTTVKESEPQRSVRNQHSSPTDEKCVYKCGRQGTKKKYPDCSHALCDRCFVPPFESECPICKPITDNGNKMIKKITEEKASKGGNNTESEESDKCPICMDAITNPKHLTCGHDFHYDCIKQSQKKQPGCPICGKEMKETIKETASKEGNIRQSEETENCPICMDILTKPKCLPCGHNFHADCIMQSLEYKPACPICGTVMGQIIGNQPEGTITVNVQNYSLPGYNDCNTIEIFYNIPDGHQQENHPHPGKPYKGTHRKAFLPDNSEGRKVLELLKIAFKRKLIFTIGESRTTGKTDIVTWNDIHHKTRVDGGPTNFGYPDKTYLSRVQEELAAKGVTEKDIKPDDISCTIS